MLMLTSPRILAVLAVSIGGVWGAAGCSSADDDRGAYAFGSSGLGGRKSVEAGTTDKDAAQGGKSGGGDAAPESEVDSAAELEAGPEAGTGGTSSGQGGAGAAAGAGGTNAGGSSTGGAAGSPLPTPDCSAIDAHPDYELCKSGPGYCEAVFTNGNGCAALCAAAGLTCVSRYGGSPGCGGPELSNPFDCLAENGNASDWCRCEGTGGTAGAAGQGGSGGSLNCGADPGNPTKQLELDKDDAVYTQRHNWVVKCSPHAYTASSAEHESCDDEYSPDGTRKGTATFHFLSVPKGEYDVFIESKHSVNRNPKGALFIVDGHSKTVDQTTGSGYIWDLHGRYCLFGSVDVVLDSTVNGGSDAVSKVRLTPAK